MKALPFLLLVLASACATRARWPPDAKAWREVESAPCAFTLRMPGPPSVRAGADRYAIEVTQYAVALPPGYVYTALCASADTPRMGEEAERFVRERFESERGVVERQGWQVREARLLRIGSCPGSEVISVDPKGTEFVTRFVWAGDRSFFLGASGPSRAGSVETARLMIESFRSPLCGQGE